MLRVLPVKRIGSQFQLYMGAVGGTRNRDLNEPCPNPMRHPPRHVRYKDGVGVQFNFQFDPSYKPNTDENLERSMTAVLDACLY